MPGPTKRTRDRLSRAVRKSERERPAPTNRRRKYPVGGGGDRWWRGVLTENLASGSTALFQRQKPDGAGGWVSVGDPVACQAETTFADGPIPSGTVGAVAKRFGVWWLIRVYWCPEAA